MLEEKVTTAGLHEVDDREGEDLDCTETTMEQMADVQELLEGIYRQRV